MKRAANDIHSLVTELERDFREIQRIGQVNIESTNARVGELQEFINSLQALNKHNQNIVGTVKLLEDIALQTNILALNASVEAARAGEYGKGFSIIADAVRELANRSQEASGSITEAIEDSGMHTMNIVEKARRSSVALGEITKSIDQIGSSIADSIDMLERNQGITKDIGGSVDTMEINVEENLRAVQETSELSIRLGLDLEALNQALHSDSDGEMSASFIKPEHVYHFNLINNLPDLWSAIQRNNISINDYNFPESRDKSITPSKVYRRMDKALLAFSKKHGVRSEHYKKADNDIKPVDVLKLSIQFCNTIRSRYPQQNIDRQLLCDYNEWKKRQSNILPGDVYHLASYFDTLVGKIPSKAGVV